MIGFDYISTTHDGRKWGIPASSEDDYAPGILKAEYCTMQ